MNPLRPPPQSLVHLMQHALHEHLHRVFVLREKLHEYLILLKVIDDDVAELVLLTCTLKF